MPLKAPLLLALLAASAAPAQTVYRCGNSYAATPCAGATAIDVTDTRTAADARQASQAAADDRKRAEAMEKARLAQQKNAPRALVIGPKDPPPQAEAPPHGKARKDKKKEKAEDPNIFTAAAPREAKKK